jgi:hypothetical protein
MDGPERWVSWAVMCCAEAGLHAIQKAKPQRPPSMVAVDRWGCLSVFHRCPIHEASRRGLGAAMLRKPRALAKLVSAHVCVRGAGKQAS